MWVYRPPIYIYICIDYICTIRDHNPPYIVSFENIDRTFDEQCYRNAKLIVVLIAMWKDYEFCGTKVKPEKSRFVPLTRWLTAFLTKSRSGASFSCVECASILVPIFQWCAEEWCLASFISIIIVFVSIEMYNGNRVGDSFLYSKTWYSSSRISIVNNLIIYKMQ